MDGYMTIGEVAKVKQVSIKALRYYEKIGILEPTRNQENNYRHIVIRIRDIVIIKMSRCWPST